MAKPWPETTVKPKPTAAALDAMRAQLVVEGLDHATILRGLRQCIGRLQSPGAIDAAGFADPTEALADALAAVCDVLAFYEERIINEGYLATAVERRSIFELARLVGYAPSAGLAATTYLRYAIDQSETQGVLIRAGSKVAAVPQPGMPQQVFETSRALFARPELNVMKIAAAGQQSIGLGTKRLYLNGADSGLGAGNLIRAVTDAGVDAYFVVKAVQVDRQNDRTVVETVLRYGFAIPRQPEPTPAPAAVKPAEDSKAMPLRGMPACYNLMPAGYAIGGANLLSMPGVGEAGTVIEAFRRRASVFGHNAPELPLNPREPQLGRQAWQLDEYDSTHPDVIDIEGHYPALMRDSNICIEVTDRTVHSDDLEIYTVKQVELISRTAYGLVGNATRLYLDRPWKSRDWPGAERYEEVVQRVGVHFDAATLTLSMVHLDSFDAAAAETGVMIEVYAPGLVRGRHVILDGAAPKGKTMPKTWQPEVLQIADVRHSEFTGHNNVPSGRPKTTILFAPGAIKFSYDPATVRIYANVVEATHGETYEQVLGSGDGTREHQSFGLARRPLTQLATGDGKRTEVTVHVADENWTPVDSLAADQGGHPVFAVDIDQDATANVVFGNGLYGARLPTGRENVSARYRVGLGVAGNLGPDLVKLPIDHPLGVQEIHSLASSGGADPEPIERTRINAPAIAMALGRVVSEDDYEGFARGFPGIAKAVANRPATTLGSIILVSILGDPEAPLSKHDPRQRALARALERAGSEAQVVVTNGRVLSVAIAARVRLTEGAQWEATERAIQTALADAFCFERRQLGQTAYASEALAVIHSVAAVTYAALTQFYCLERLAENRQHPMQAPEIVASSGRYDGQHASGAELLIIRPDVRDLMVITQDIEP